MSGAVGAEANFSYTVREQDGAVFVHFCLGTFPFVELEESSPSGLEGSLHGERGF